MGWIWFGLLVVLLGGGLLRWRRESAARAARALADARAGAQRWYEASSSTRSSRTRIVPVGPDQAELSW